MPIEGSSSREDLLLQELFVQDQVNAIVAVAKVPISYGAAITAVAGRAQKARGD